jgi:2-aminoadipate transaminase
MLEASARPGILSFALGLPAAELFPAEKYRESMNRVLSTNPRALQYGPPLPSLRKQIVKLMELRGVRCSEEQIFLTAGAQQGTHMLTRLLLDPGGCVVTEEMTYPGFQQVLQPYCPRVLSVSTDRATGMNVDELERLLAAGEKPALIYAVTDGHNPLSVSMSLEKRRQLVQLARRYRVPIIEDDPYGFLYYGERPLPPLRAFDDEWVYYVGTFSKILAPSLRAGWIVAPEELVAPLSVIKESIDINMAPLTQHVIADYLATGHLEQHVQMLRQEYRARRDALHLGLQEHFPGDASWQIPQSGVFIWVELAENVDTGDLLRVAIDTEKVAFIPGFAFNTTAKSCARNTMRLNFSNSSVELIADGIARLGRCLKPRAFVSTSG